MGLKKSKEDLERLVRKVDSQSIENCRGKVAITPQEKPSHISRVFGSVFTLCRRLDMPFS